MTDTKYVFETHRLSRLEQLLDTLTIEGLKSFLQGKPDGIVCKKGVWFSFFKRIEIETFITEKAYLNMSVRRSIRERLSSQM